MRRYVIRPFSDWAKTELLEIDARLWTPPVDVAAWGQIARTAEGLLVRLTAREAHVRAVEAGPLWAIPGRTAASSSSSRLCREMRGTST